MSNQRKIFTRIDGYVDVLVPNPEAEVAVADEYYDAASYLSKFGSAMFTKPNNVGIISSQEMYKYADGRLEYRVRFTLALEDPITDTNSGNFVYPVQFKSGTYPNLQLSSINNGTIGFFGSFGTAVGYETQRFNIISQRAISGNHLVSVLVSGRWK